MKDTLRVQPNERIDIDDFRRAARDGLVDSFSELGNQFICNPTSYSKSVLSGFAMTNPTGSQLKVTRGRAILHQRYGGTVVKSLLTTSGDESKTIDLSTYPNNTYGIYIRFEAVPGEPEGRVFWNPTGTGSEYTQTMETRYVAGWSLRIESSNPGEEWLQIGTVLKPGMVITDQRDLYFEGVVSSNYASGWSSEGGGESTDRNADRASYGVGDLHTFAAATRQCIEDVKGRGLRRWFEKGIGGINIGFDDDPTEGTLAVGDADFYIKLVGALATISFGSNANFEYHRTNKQFSWNSSSAQVMTLDENYLSAGSSVALGTATSHWNSLFVNATNTYGARYLSCCTDDVNPSFSNQVEDSIALISASLLYSGGYSGAQLSRKKDVYTKLTGLPQTLKKQALVEGLQAMTEIDHTANPGDTLENSIHIGTGVAVIGGQEAFLYGTAGGAVVLSDLWDGDPRGGLTTEAKTYLSSATNGYENCLWMYIWLRSDGTIWLEPFGPEIKSDYVWTDGNGRYAPRTQSGLPQSGFSNIDYLLIDVCWLVYGKAKTSGTASDIVNFSSGIYMGNGYRHLERAKYSDGTTIEPVSYYTASGFTSPLAIPLDNVDGTDRYKRNPGVPCIARKARIAVIGDVTLPNTAGMEVYIGSTKSASTVNNDLMPIGANDIANVSFNETNNTGSTKAYEIREIVDVDVNHEIDGTSDLYRSYIVIENTILSGSPVLALNIQTLGFYWDRFERDILTFSMT